MKFEYKRAAEMSPEFVEDVPLDKMGDEIAPRHRAERVKLGKEQPQA
jgi:hypothetical protein